MANAGNTAIWYLARPVGLISVKTLARTQSENLMGDGDFDIDDDEIVLFTSTVEPYAICILCRRSITS